MDFQDLLGKNGGFEWQNGSRGGAMVTPNKLVLIFGVLTSVPILVKIDQESDRESAHRWTDANRFYNLSHAICYSCGADK